MLFIPLAAAVLLLDAPNPPIGRTEPVRPSFEFHAPPPLNAWHQIQPELNRSTGRIIDEPTWQLDRMDLLRTMNRFDPTANFNSFQLDRDRQFQIDAWQLDQQRLSQRSTNQQREAQMKLKEYELYLNDTSDPFSAVAAQAQADRNALLAAKNRRDEQLRAAGGDASKVRVIEQIYQKERTRILGFDFDSSTPPTTSPAK